MVNTYLFFDQLFKYKNEDSSNNELIIAILESCAVKRR